MFKNTHLIIFMALAIIGLSLSACETVDGAGRDIEHAGESIQHSTD